MKRNASAQREIEKMRDRLESVRWRNLAAKKLKLMKEETGGGTARRCRGRDGVGFFGLVITRCINSSRTHWANSYRWCCKWATR